MQYLIDYWWLVPVLFMTSMMTSAMGAGGTTISLAVLGAVLPPPALLPVHSVLLSVQSGVRMGLLWKRIDWQFVAVVVIASVIGAVLAGPIILTVPDTEFRILLGMALLYLVWLPKLKNPIQIPRVDAHILFTLMAAIVAVVTMFTGAAGILFTAIRHRLGRNREGLLGDMSAVVLSQQTMKVTLFWVTGFVFGPYLPLIAALAAASIVGTVVGVVLLRRMPAVLFDRLFRWAVTFAAIWIIVKVAL